MEILLISLCVAIAILHILSALFDKTLSRVFTYVSIALHPAMIIPMLLIPTPLELAALIFMSSAAFYAVASVVAQGLKAKLSPNGEVTEDDV